MSCLRYLNSTIVTPASPSPKALQDEMISHILGVLNESVLLDIVLLFLFRARRAPVINVTGRHHPEEVFV